MPSGFANVAEAERRSDGIPDSNIPMFRRPGTPVLRGPAFAQLRRAGENEKGGNWRRRMGIEPTWDFVEPHSGFEDRERHQVALHLRDRALRRRQHATDGSGCHFQTTA